MNYLEKIPFTITEQEKLNAEKSREKPGNREKEPNKSTASSKVAEYKLLNQRFLLVNLINDDPLKTAQAIFAAQGYEPIHNQLTEAVENKESEKIIKYFKDWLDSVEKELTDLTEKSTNKLSAEEVAYKDCLKTKHSRLQDYLQILKLGDEIKELQ
ncbi:MAG: hypothetical protein HY973_04060 [Candidatus Kerfeldbacteria bacterium]|nr:hypothetical protein [Candidatus Kerfeldbacteria bacterium]